MKPRKIEIGSGNAGSRIEARTVKAADKVATEKQAA
jgi:hypothetical protein